MFLAIDIGNSLTKFGIYKNSELLKKLAIQTNHKANPTEILQILNREGIKNAAAVYVSTVVQGIHETYFEVGKNLGSIDTRLIDHASNFNIRSAYNPPDSCGIDRIIAADSAVQKFGSPIIVCDFGTATTIDFVDGENVFRGGIITPGLETLGKALFSNTSQLPKVTRKIPKRVIGNNTETAIQSGIFYGYIGLVDGLIQRIFVESNEPVQIVSTGGDAGLISEYAEFVSEVDENLLLDGLNILHTRIASNSEPNNDN